MIKLHNSSLLYIPSLSIIPYIEMRFNMTLEVLVSAVNQQIRNLAERMHLESDAVIINQTDHFAYEEYKHQNNIIRGYNFAEKGVGLSRNNALLRAKGDIVLFSDEDIIYDAGYADKVLKEFEKHPEADMLLFNIECISGMPEDIQRTPLQYVERDFRLQTLPFPFYLVVAPNTAMEKTACF